MISHYLCGMNYRQYSDHIKLCKYLGREPEGEFKEFYDFLTELWKDMEFIVINEHNILFHKGDEFFVAQDFKNGWLECYWDRVWSFLRTTKDTIHQLSYVKSNAVYMSISIILCISAGTS